jgi:hypothetical protein
MAVKPGDFFAKYPSVETLRSQKGKNAKNLPFD